jgi:hypothetical protein
MSEFPGASIAAEVKDTASQLVLAICGVVTSLLAAGIVVVGQDQFGVNVSSFSLWFIIPVGAILTGMVAASGYYFAAVGLHRRPDSTLLLNSALIGLGTFFVIRYLVYLTLRFDDGSPVSALVGFFEYYQVAIEQKSMSIGTRGRLDMASTGALGGWGYAVEGIQLLGFLVGGVAVYGFLQDRPYCPNCGRYVQSKHLLTDLDGGKLDDYLADRAVELPGLGQRLRAAIGGRPISGFGLQLDTCGRCADRRLRITIFRGDNSETAATYGVTGMNVDW